MWHGLQSALRLQGLNANSCISPERPAALSIGRIWCTSVAIVVLPCSSQSSQTGWADRYAARNRRQRLEFISRVYSLVLCLFILMVMAGVVGAVGEVAGAGIIVMMSTATALVMRVRVMRLVMSHVRTLMMSGS